MSVKKVYDRFVKKFALFHNTLVLVLWLAVEVLMVYHFYKHMYTGFKFDFSLLQSLDLWYSVGTVFRFAVLFHSVNLLFFLGNYINVYNNLLDKKKHCKMFLSLLFHHSKGLLLYFVTMRVLGEDANVRWTLVNLSAWTLLNVLDCLNSFNLYLEQKNEFLEWLNYKLFMFLYPLLSVSELMLVTSSFPNLKRFDKYKMFPSPMPNVFNFTFNLHLLYKLSPAPLAMCSTLVYFNKCKYT